MEKEGGFDLEKRKIIRVFRSRSYRMQTITHMFFQKFSQKNNWIVFESFLGKITLTAVNIFMNIC